MENFNLEKFNPTKAELLTLADDGRKLIINGTQDKDGYLAVHAHRMKLKNARVAIAKTGKAAREEALEFQRKVIAYEKELIEIIEPIEVELKAKQDAIDLAVLKEKRAALLPERIQKLNEINVIYNENDLLEMDDAQFQEFYNRANAAFLAEKEAGIKKEQEEREAKIREEQEKIEAEKRKLEEEKRIEEAKKQAEKEAQEKAIKDAELAKIKAEEEKQAAIEAERQKAEEEKRRLIAEQERKERERIAEEERIKAEAEEKKRKEQEEQEALEKRRKYQNFLDRNHYKDDGSFKIEKTGNKVILYKKIDELKI